MTIAGCNNLCWQWNKCQHFFKEDKIDAVSNTSDYMMSEVEIIDVK